MPPDERNSADPLAAIGGDDPAGTQLAEMWTRWLATELLDDQYAKLEQAGSTPETATPLARVFIDVAASSGGSLADEPDEQDAPHKDADEPGAEPWNPSAGGPAPGLLHRLLGAEPVARDKRRLRGDHGEVEELEDDAPRGDFVRVRRRTGPDRAGCFLIVGGPGQGKSTLVQYLCQLHRVELLRARQGLLSTSQKQACALLSERAAAEGLPRPERPCLPLRIVLRDMAAWMFRGKVEPGEAIVRFVAERMTRALKRKAPVEVEAMRAALARVPWLLVLDGLDEVPVTAGRAEVLRAVSALLDSAASGAPHLVVATTRPQGYSGELGDFEGTRLLGLSRARALAYTARLVEARYPGQTSRHEEIQERLALAWNEPNSRRLMTTPLQVSVMASLVAQVGRAPADRWRLFSDYYRVMYQREVERPNLAQADLLRNLRKQIDELHRVAGLWLQTRSETAGETDALLSEEELGRLIDSVLERNGHDFPEERRDLAEQIFEAAVERLVFLVHAEEGKYGFEIRSLQELMAAEALLTGGDAEVTQRLRHIAPLDAWRNVFLFAAGKCFAEIWHLAPVIARDICPWLNEAHEDPAVRASLTGSEIALALIEDGAARNQPTLIRLLARLALRLLELPPSPIHVQLARIGRVEIESLLRPAIEERLGLPEGGKRLSAWVVLATLADDGVAWAAERASSQWPDDGQARRDIVTAVNKAGRAAGGWLQAKMVAALDDFPPMFVRGVELDANPYIPLGWLKNGIFALARVEHEVEYPLLAGGKRTGVSLSLSPSGVSDQSILHFRSVQHAPASWMPLVVAARFQESPTASGLADALRMLAEKHDFQACAAMRSYMPWPLAQAVMEARDPDALRRLASRAESGRCGDRAEWKAAEKRWAYGIPIEALTELKNAWPLGERRIRSFPYAAFTVDWGGTTSRPWRDELIARGRGILDTLLAAYRRASAERQTMLAYVVARFLSGWWEMSQIDGVLQPAEALEIWSHIGSLPPPRMVLALMPKSPNEAWIRLLNDVGREQNDTLYSEAREMLMRVAELYAQFSDIEPVGLLRLVALSAISVSVESEIPYLSWTIDPQQFPERSECRFLAALVKSLIEYRNEETSMALLPSLIVSLPDDPKRSSILGYYIGGSWRTYAQPSILAELLARLPTHAWRLASTAVTALLRYRKRRASALEDPSVWAHLGLPSPAPTRRASSRPPPHLINAQVDAVHIEGIRAFDTIDLPIPPPRPPENRISGRWITLLGENGTGKTTILRSIALALTDPSLADTIVKSSRSPHLAHDLEKGLVRVEASGVAFSARVARGATGNEELEGDAGRERPLLFAYGCRRGSALGGAARAVSFKPYEAIATLFEEGAGLIHAETWLKERALAAKEKDAVHARQLFDAIRQALLKVLPGVKRIDVKAEGVWVEGPAVGRTMLEGLSDGYLSTMGWVVDLIARWIAHKERPKEPAFDDIFEQMEGIVLVDEIDLHLHPRWQVRVIDDVRALFPRMTFIVTTHNPLTLLGARPGEVIVLRRSEIEVEGDDPGAPVSPRDRTRIEAFQQDIPPGLTVDQVLTGAWFGLASTLDKDTLRLLEEHRGLLREGTGRDDPKRLALEAELRKRLGGFADTSLERLAQGIAAKLLPEQAGELGPRRRERLRKHLLAAVAAEAAAPPGSPEAAAPSEEQR
jgi:energy-coupling factor transporter ATP-binding protein EcfA2